jgi:hypothetical protein
MGSKPSTLRNFRKALEPLDAWAAEQLDSVCEKLAEIDVKLAPFECEERTTLNLRSLCNGVIVNFGCLTAENCDVDFKDVCNRAQAAGNRRAGEKYIADLADALDVDFLNANKINLRGKTTPRPLIRELLSIESLWIESINVAQNNIREGKRP